MSIYSVKKTIYIIRHGETDYNKMNIVQGSGVDTSLNNTGENQASMFYQAYKNISFDRIYISALQRTRQSVKHFLEAGIPFESMKELNEISWGEFEGKEQTQAQREIYYQVVNQWNNGDQHAKIPNGESPRELQDRQQAALDIILSRHHEKSILICMHGRAMKSFLCLLLGKSIAEMEQFPHTNLCLYQLEWVNGKFELIKQNDIAHLQ